MNFLEVCNGTTVSKLLSAGNFVHGAKLGDFTTTASFVAVRCDEVGWLQAGRSRVRFPMVSFIFFINTILPAAL
jgi:hypothetical protein